MISSTTFRIASFKALSDVSLLILSGRLSGIWKLDAIETCVPVIVALLAIYVLITNYRGRPYMLPKPIRRLLYRMRGY